MCQLDRERLKIQIQSLSIIKKKNQTDMCLKYLLYCFDISCFLSCKEQVSVLLSQLIKIYKELCNEIICL